MKLEEKCCKLQTLDMEVDAKTNEIFYVVLLLEKGCIRFYLFKSCSFKLGWRIWLLLLILYGSFTARGKLQWTFFMLWSQQYFLKLFLCLNNLPCSESIPVIHFSSFSCSQGIGRIWLQHSESLLQTFNLNAIRRNRHLIGSVPVRWEEPHPAIRSRTDRGSVPGGSHGSLESNPILYMI